MPSVNVVVSGQPDQLSFEPPQDGPQRAVCTGQLEDGLVRHGSVADVPAIAALIEANLAEGHLLPRTLEDLTRHAERFLVVTVDGRVAGCAELAPLSRAVAEVRSLVVDATCRGRGLGIAAGRRAEARRAARRLLDAVRVHACAEPFHPAGIFDGAASVAAGEDPDRLLQLPEVPHVRAYAMALALKGGSLRTSAAGQRPYLAMPPAIEIKTIDVKTGALTDERVEGNGTRPMIVPVDGGITAPKGFRAAGVACGIKANGKLDLGLVASDDVASAAAVFTTNQAVAAPVIVSREHLARGEGSGARGRRQQRLRQRLHRRRRPARRADDDRRSRARARLRSRGSAGRVHRRDRRGARSAQGDRRHHRGRRCAG